MAPTPKQPRSPLWGDDDKLPPELMGPTDEQKDDPAFLEWLKGRMEPGKMNSRKAKMARAPSVSDSLMARGGKAKPTTKNKSAKNPDDYGTDHPEDRPSHGPGSSADDGGDGGNYHGRDGHNEPKDDDADRMPGQPGRDDPFYNSKKIPARSKAKSKIRTGLSTYASQIK